MHENMIIMDMEHYENNEIKNIDRSEIAGYIFYYRNGTCEGKAEFYDIHGSLDSTQQKNRKVFIWKVYNNIK